MRKVIVGAMASMDGVMQAPGGIDEVFGVAAHLRREG